MRVLSHWKQPWNNSLIQQTYKTPDIVQVSSVACQTEEDIMQIKEDISSSLPDVLAILAKKYTTMNVPRVFLTLSPVLS